MSPQSQQPPQVFQTGEIVKDIHSGEEYRIRAINLDNTLTVENCSNGLTHTIPNYKVFLNPIIAPSPAASGFTFPIGNIIYDFLSGYEGEIVEILSKDYRVKTANKIFHLIPHASACLSPAPAPRILTSGVCTIPMSVPPFNPNVAMAGWGAGSSSGPKFKVNDSVRNKITGAKGEIRSIDTILDEYTYWTWYTAESTAKYTKESDLELISQSDKWGIKCECGSDSVPGYQGLHSYWCPKNGKG